MFSIIFSIVFHFFRFNAYAINTIYYDLNGGSGKCLEGVLQNFITWPANPPAHSTQLQGAFAELDSHDVGQLTSDDFVKAHGHPRTSMTSGNGEGEIVNKFQWIPVLWEVHVKNLWVCSVGSVCLLFASFFLDEMQYTILFECKLMIFSEVLHQTSSNYVYLCIIHVFRKLFQGLHRLGYTEDRGCEFHRSLMKSLVAIVVKRVLRDPFTRMPVLSSARWTPTRQGFWPWRAQASTIKDNGFFIENGQGLSNLLQGSLHGLHRLQNCSFHHVHTYSSNKSVVFRSIFLWLCRNSLCILCDHWLGVNAQFCINWFWFLYHETCGIDLRFFPKQCGHTEGFLP